MFRSFASRSVTATCLLLIGLNPTSAAARSLPDTVYLLTSFRGNGDGLHLAYSTDGDQWTELRGVFLKPCVGGKLMRDPHLLLGPDNVFRLVWTSGWRDNGIGYASSSDLTNWSEQRFLPVMADVPGTKNCWAPETFYDAARGQYIITWSSDVEGRFPETVSPHRMNNRTYYVTTRDFETFSKPAVLIEPGFDHIDTTLLQRGEKTIAVIKEGDQQARGIAGPIHLLQADDPLGPYTLIKPPITTEFAEGPTLYTVGDETRLIVDFYRAGRIGVYATTDGRNWRDITSRTSVVRGHRHGTALTVPGALVARLLPAEDPVELRAPDPILDGFTADPAIRAFGDTYYVYPTSDKPNWNTTEFAVWSSKNLVDWKKEGVILDVTKDLTWADLQAWAPDCIERNGTYYFYFCARGKIGVATAPTPAGPFKDALDRPLLQREGAVRTNTIDPYPFIDDDGQAYLYYGNGQPAQAVRLKPDMVTLDGDPVDIDLRDFREGIVVFKRHGRYYFMWSIDDARSPNYRVGWGIADSPLGPVRSPDADSGQPFIVLQKHGPAVATAHHSVVNVPGTDRWYAVYHRHAIPDGSGYKRQTCLVRMEFNPDGSIKPMDPLTAPFKPGDRGEPIEHPRTPRKVAKPATLTINATRPGKPISPDLFGVFFEDINSAVDGGLYAELVQNRSFEYQATGHPSWNALTSWTFTQRDGGRGWQAIDTDRPIHANNPRHLVLHVDAPGAGVGVTNAGYDGIPVQAGKQYDLSLFARQLYSGRRWGRDVSVDARPMPIAARLESSNGDVLGEASFEVAGRDWRRYTATLAAQKSDDEARLVVLLRARGGLALDVISLFPQDTFRGRKNGLRADLAQAIADLQPKFVRFPGGCLVHGRGLDNMYRWKDTIGPIETRREQPNIWGYYQSVGLGYFEYFQFCEDIGAKPVPIVPAGVCCQNAGHMAGGHGQDGLPLDEMPAYIQEVLDLIEYANGPADSQWGAKRAAAGHPAPFQLEYLGIGNEDKITPAFEERFRLIYEAVKEKHPEIKVIGTVGPAPAGDDYEAGWRLANALGVPIVDEHYYVTPDWFWNNLHRYDACDREGPLVYLGEYAAHDQGRRTTLRSALAEAAYLTSLERNGDFVVMTSYAPLLGKLGKTQWNPNLIYFTNTQVVPTINYHVQRIFASNAGDAYLPSELATPEPTHDFASSAVRDGHTGDIVLKLVNGSPRIRPLQITIAGAQVVSSGTKMVLADNDPLATNSLETPERVVPRTAPVEAGSQFDYAAPPHSLTIIRLKTRDR
jgi:alpha-L-arabinofuranosidase